MSTSNANGDKLVTVCKVVVYYPMKDMYKLEYQTETAFKHMQAPRFIKYDVLSVIHQDHPDFNTKVVTRWNLLCEPTEQHVLNMGIQTPLVYIYACEFCGGDLLVHAGIADMDKMQPCRKKRDAALRKMPVVSIPPPHTPQHMLEAHTPQHMLEAHTPQHMLEAHELSAHYNTPGTDGNEETSGESELPWFIDADYAPLA